MAGVEATIERKVTNDAFKKLGIQSLKLGIDGWPDRVFLMPGGRPLFIEFKAPGGVLSPRQAFRIDCLRTWGYDVQVCSDVTQALQSLQSLIITR